MVNSWNCAKREEMDQCTVESHFLTPLSNVDRIQRVDGFRMEGFHAVPDKEVRRKTSSPHERLCNWPYPATHELFLSIFLDSGSITLSQKVS